LKKRQSIGVRTGNWLTLQQTQALLNAPIVGFAPARRASSIDPITALRHE